MKIENELSADYVIVGGGSAGCTLAGRLAENPTTSVALLEEGPSDWSPYIHMPVTYYKTAKGPLLKRYAYEPSAAQAVSVTPSMAQARVLGGGSSVNAMLYVRGVPDDYDNWAKMGATGWDYAGVLPYFKKAENNDLYSNDAHSNAGPIGVSAQQSVLPLTKSWLQACQQAGLPYNADFNSGDQAGCGIYQVTARDGRRSNTARAYLKKRKNLHVNTGCCVVSILIEGKKAVGVVYRRGNQKLIYRARREVIISAGALVSPKLLMLSGIGPAAQLKQHKIEVVLDAPAVGKNYQDHMELSMIYELNGPYSYDKYKKLHWQLWAGAQYAFFKSGPVTSNVIEAGGFWWSKKKPRLPDIQFFFLAGAGIEEGVGDVPGGNGCTISVTQTRPESIGYIELKNADPSDPPRIFPNYLTSPIDVECTADAVLLIQKIMSMPAMRALVKRSHVPSRPLEIASELAQFVKSEAHAGLHPCGTCRMGDGPECVVDSQLRVKGIDRLRVVDASIIPRIISGNLNAVAIMIGEKAYDLIVHSQSRT